MQNANKTRGISPLGSSGVIAQWGAPSFIKSIQSWSSSYTGTSQSVTITAVDIANSILIFNGFNANDGNALTVSEHMQNARITATTTITVQRSSAGNAGARQANGFVIEFMPGVVKSIQQIQQTPVGGTGTPLTITGVNLSKSFLVSGGYAGGNTGGVTGQWTGPRVYFSSATQVIFAFDSGSGLVTTSGEATVVEFH